MSSNCFAAVRVLRQRVNYARRRRQHRKIRLAWRKSGGARRSFGWVPFKVRTIRYRAGQVYFAGRWKPAAESILDHSIPSLGIDLGLKRLAAFSDAGMPPVDAERFYRDLEPALGSAHGVCGAIHDRDVNAAQNILAAGHRRLAEGILVH